MKPLSDQLREAKDAKVALHPGLLVKVKTKAGELVTRGRITAVHPDEEVVFVANEDAGADLRVGVDTKHYVIWVEPPTNYVPRLPGETTLYMRTSRPGVHAFSNKKM